MNLQVTPEKAQLSTQLSEDDSRAHQNPAQAEVSSTAAQTCGGSIWWCTRQFASCHTVCQMHKYGQEHATREEDSFLQPTSYINDLILSTRRTSPNRGFRV